MCTAQIGLLIKYFVIDDLLKMIKTAELICLLLFKANIRFSALKYT